MMLIMLVLSGLCVQSTSTALAVGLPPMPDPYEQPFNVLIIGSPNGKPESLAIQYLNGQWVYCADCGTIVTVMRFGKVVGIRLAPNKGLRFTGKKLRVVFAFAIYQNRMGINYFPQDWDASKQKSTIINLPTIGPLRMRSAIVIAVRPGRPTCDVKLTNCAPPG